MKTLAALLLILNVPAAITAQSVPGDAGTSVVNIHNKEIVATNYSIVTPILLRPDTYGNYLADEHYAYERGSAFPFISSLIIPGTGQMANRTWWRAGLYLAVEAVSIYAVLEYSNRGRRGERNYETYADENWSVVQYSNWLIEYHNLHNIDNPHIGELQEILNGIDPAFSTGQDWKAVDINVLRNAERITPYFTSDHAMASNFSHTLPEYGSQQYYELISKYYQYQAGWRDYNQFHDSIGHLDERYLIDRNGAYASPMFFDGVDMAYQFNRDFRTGRHFLSLLIVNHVVSAFDAYFTVKVKQNRVRATSSMVPGKQVVVSYSF